MSKMINIGIGISIFGVSLLLISPVSAATELTGCTEIIKPGEYHLVKDIKTSKRCLYVHDVHDVSIDCQGHTMTIPLADETVIGPIQFRQVNNFTLENCRMKTTNDEKKRAMMMSLSDVRNGLIRNLVVETTSENAGTWIDVGLSDQLTFTNNTLKSDIQFRRATNTLIRHNILTSAYRESMTAALIIFGPDGHHNSIIENRLAGPEDPEWYKTLDDGVIIQNGEHHDIVRDNIISGNFDCGIETLGHVQDTVFDHNQILNSTICGIGGWYWNSWKGNTVSNNIIDISKEAFYFLYTYGLQAEGTKVYFQDNTFVNNVFVNAIANTYQADVNLRSRSNISGADVRAVTDADFVWGNNRFRNNDFGAAARLFFDPQDIIVDDGGNRCAEGAPLVCITTEPSNRPTPVVLPATIGAQPYVASRVVLTQWEQYTNKKFGFTFMSSATVQEYDEKHGGAVKSFSVALTDSTGAITVYKKNQFFKERPWIATPLSQVTKNYKKFKEDRSTKDRAIKVPGSGPAYLQWLKRKVGGIPALDHRYASPGGVGRSVYVIRGAYVYEIFHDRGYVLNKKSALNTAPYKDFEKFLESIRFVSNKPNKK